MVRNLGLSARRRGLQAAQATLDRLRADGAVSRRPATLTVAGEGEAPAIERYSIV